MKIAHRMRVGVFEICAGLLIGVLLPGAAPVIGAENGATGDRIGVVPKSITDWVPASLPRDSYRVQPGDRLTINVQGRATLDYHASGLSEEQPDADEVTVTPDGYIHLSLMGKTSVASKTVEEIEETVRTGLSRYIRQFEVSVSVAGVRTVNIRISGEAANPGPLTVPAVSTVSLAALQAGIKPTGTTRCVTLIRGKDRRKVDLYRMMVTGDASGDIELEPGDCVHVPPVTEFVEVSGEVVKPGRFEMVCFGGDGQTFRVNDLLELALGPLPSAALGRCFVERIGDDGKKVAVNLNLRNEKEMETALRSGDSLVVPSISAFQPIIRLIGEFKGDGVYQRITGSTQEDVQNKSGIYFLKKGQTVLDVITATGGVTPQADLKRARVERMEGGVSHVLAVDLDRLLIAGDKSADMALENGDSLVLPALADKIHVFGEIKAPGSYPYSPNRRLVDYLGDAGGTTAMAKLTDVSIVRGDADNPKVAKVSARNAIRYGSMEGNPVLEPGDIVYIPPKFLSDWRDGVQLIFTSLSLRSLLKN